MILVRKAVQEAGSRCLTRHMWGKTLSDVRLQKVKFHRSLTPANWRGKPWGVTFSDGSEKTYGAVLYPCGLQAKEWLLD